MQKTKESEKVTLYIAQRLADMAAQYLAIEDIQMHELGLPEDATIMTFTARFDNGYEADIKLCSGQTNFFIDPVLFDENGCELQCLDCPDELLGDFEFEINDKLYIVSVQQEEN